MIVRKNVTPEGTVDGLDAMAGKDVVIVPTASERVAKAVESSMRVLDDLRRYVREHRDLTAKQVSDFTARYGNPADKARAYAKHLNPEEFKEKVKELNDLVEKRLSAISNDLERRYEDLEREVEGAVEKLFAGAKRGEAAADAAPAGAEREPESR